MNTTSAGNHAEQAVAEELSRQGYEIIELNWRTPFAEIDIVATRDKTLYFVEVKYRRTPSAGDGFDYITPKKLYHMQRAAEAYVGHAGWQKGFELLAAAVTGEPDNPVIDIREV